LDHGLAWEVVTATLAGFSIALLVFWLLSYENYSVRLIDLVSFLLGFLALIGGLFSSFHYRADLLQSIDRLWARSSIVDIAFDASVDIMRLCTRVPHTPFRPPATRTADCDKLDQYLIGLKFDPNVPAALRLPDVADYSDPTGVAALNLGKREGKDLVYMGKVGTGWSRTVSARSGNSSTPW
jgi:hypothetical protein